MALIKCPECKAEISDKAIACPKCGCPNESDHIRNIERKKNDQIMFIVFIALMLILGGFFWYEARPN